MVESTRIDGLKELETALRDFAPMMQGKKGMPKNPLRSASRAMANHVKKLAISKAPEDTGRLKRAIVTKIISVKYRDKITARGDSAEHYFIGVRTGRGKDDPKGAYYGAMVETGTDKMPAQPFLRPAIEESKGVLPGIFTVKLARDMETIRRKLNK